MVKHTLRFRAYLPDDVASEAWHQIDILRQIRNHAVRDYYNSDYNDRPSDYDQHNKHIEWTDRWPTFPIHHNTPHNKLSAKFTTILKRSKNVEMKATISGDCGGKERVNFGQCRTISPVASTWITTRATTDSCDFDSKRLAGSKSEQNVTYHQQTGLMKLF